MLAEGKCVHHEVEYEVNINLTLGLTNRNHIWKQWKRIKTKLDNLVKLGIGNSKAWEWANGRKGYWRISDSHVLHMSLTNEYLASVGYDDILDRYKVLHSSYRTIVYRTVRMVV